MQRERKLIRLKNYDYSTPGAYFISICVHNRLSVFGNIINTRMELNSCGQIVEQQWKWLFEQYDYLKIDEYCIMPNHFQGIIWIRSDDDINNDDVGNSRDCSLHGRDYSLHGSIFTSQFCNKISIE
ncbi:MAG: hypothetical protein KDK45_15060 [Leptospiraceae bacterium]|nr:hypothetical protein [Leptospiraceae bacterium]